MDCIPYSAVHLKFIGDTGIYYLYVASVGIACAAHYRGIVYRTRIGDRRNISSEVKRRISVCTLSYRGRDRVEIGGMRYRFGYLYPRLGRKSQKLGVVLDTLKPVIIIQRSVRRYAQTVSDFAEIFVAGVEKRVYRIKLTVFSRIYMAFDIGRYPVKNAVAFYGNLRSDNPLRKSHNRYKRLES